MKTDLIYNNYIKYEVNKQDSKKFDETMKLANGSQSFTHRFKFDNNYGASVIKHFGSYGYEKDLFELAVLYYRDNGVPFITYNTPITNDVIGCLTNDEVLKLLEQIKNLEVK